MGGFFNVVFYAVIIVGILLFGGLTYYRIDWARHPEKYKKDVEKYEKEKEQKQRDAQQAAMQRVIDKKNGQKTQAKKEKKRCKIDKRRDARPRMGCGGYRAGDG